MRIAAKPRRRAASGWVGSSRLSASAAASHAWYIGGAPGTAVMCSSAISASEPRGSNVSWSTAHAPVAATSPKPALSP